MQLYATSAKPLDPAPQTLDLDSALRQDVSRRCQLWAEQDRKAASKARAKKRAKKAIVKRKVDVTSLRIKRPVRHILRLNQRTSSSPPDPPSCPGCWKEEGHRHSAAGESHSAPGMQFQGRLVIRVTRSEQQDTSIFDTHPRTMTYVSASNVESSI